VISYERCETRILDSPLSSNSGLRQGVAMLSALGGGVLFFLHFSWLELLLSYLSGSVGGMIPSWYRR